MTGQTFSHYLILDKLGEGGMGVVYKAEDTNLRRLVAIKFIHPRAVVQTEFRERFRREAQAAAVIDHPNVCHVHELQESGDQIFIVMSFVDGCTLKDCMETTGMSPSNAVEIAIQIAQGLKAAHQKGIIHRDLKPGNIMLSSGNEVKITDFGLALLADRSRLTAPGTILGTFSYMSPEQAQAKAVDRRSDLWALGCLLCEMLLGTPPFAGALGRTDLRDVVNAELDLKSLARISPDLRRIAAKLLQKDAAMRYQHADDVVVDLRAVQRQLPESTPLRLEPGTRRAEDATTAVDGTPAAVNAAVEKARPRSNWWIAGAALLIVGAGILLWVSLAGR